MTFGSSFGRLPNRGGKKERKNPLGETVFPKIKGPAQQRGGGRSSNVKVSPQIKGPLKERIVGGPSAVKTAPQRRVGGPPRAPAQRPSSPQKISPPFRPLSLSNRGSRHGVAVIGQFSPWPWGQHPDEAYLADALEEIGVKVYRVRQDSKPAVVKQAEWSLFTGHPKSLEHLPAWKATHPTIVWTLDWLPDFPERRPMIEAGRRATLFLTSDQYAWRTQGISNHGYLPGACESISTQLSVRPTVPCAFIGSIYNERRERIAEIVKKRGGQVLTQSSTWKYGVALSRWLQCVKVLVGDNFRNDIQGYWSTRNYIVPGAGGFLLTPNVPGLGLQFKPDEEVGVYDSIEDLEKRLGYWIANDEVRERVRQEGYARVHREHTWKNRAMALLMHMAEKINAAS